MPAYDTTKVTAPPLTPFQNSMSGPAGEYSDAYKAIVQQYRDDVDSAKALRDQQNGTPPLVPTPGLIHKSGNDIVRIDPVSGSANLIYRSPAPEPKLPPLVKPTNPYTSPYDIAQIHAARTSYDSAQKAFDKATREMIANPSDANAMAAREQTMQDLAKAKADLAASRPVAPPLNPTPVLTPPVTDTTTAPAYHPAPMMAPGEVAPPGSIVIGGRNRLDAPPRTTQSAAKRFKYVNGQLIAQ